MTIFHVKFISFFTYSERDQWSFILGGYSSCRVRATFMPPRLFFLVDHVGVLVHSCAVRRFTICKSIHFLNLSANQTSKMGPSLRLQSWTSIARSESYEQHWGQLITGFSKSHMWPVALSAFLTSRKVSIDAPYSTDFLQHSSASTYTPNAINTLQHSASSTVLWAMS